MESDFAIFALVHISVAARHLQSLRVKGLFNIYLIDANPYKTLSTGQFRPGIFTPKILPQ